MSQKFFYRCLAAVVPFLIVLTSGCNSRILSGILPEPTIESTPVALMPTPTPPGATPTPVVDTSTITIWVPPQFDPFNGSAAGNLLKNQITAFEEKNPDYQVNVRVKAISGQASLMESLEVTAAAAPSALPGLVAFSRSDLETAALRGLIVPIEGFSTILDDTDWYDYARTLATVQTSIMGLPFAGDSLLIVYRPGRLGTNPAGWEDILKTGQPVIFPADDPQAILTQAFYLSEEGKMQDDQGRPALDKDPLSSTMIFLSRGFQLGIFPQWICDYQTYKQGWQAYQEQKGQIAVVWTSQFLSTLPADTTAVPLFPLGESNTTPTDGWVWALSDPIPERRAVTIKLAEMLVQSDFLAGWTSSVGYLPPRPSSLAAWKNQSLQALANRVIPGANIQSPNDIQDILAPILHDTTLKVIKNQQDPIQTAQKAIDILNPPQAQ